MLLILLIRSFHTRSSAVYVGSLSKPPRHYGVFQITPGDRMLNHDRFKYQSAIDADAILQLLFLFMPDI